MVTETTIDPSIIPWSYRGSYLCLATRSGSNGSLTPGHDIYFISHTHPGGLPLFSLRPRVEPPSLGFPKSPSLVGFSATPSRMEWSYGGRVIAEATFADDKTIRMRGSVPMDFNTEGSLNVDQWRCWLFKVPPKRNGSPTVEFNSTPNTALRFIALKGDFILTNDAPHDPGFHDNNRQITIAGDDWEILIAERDEEGEHDGTFDESVVSLDKTFNAYVSGMCPWNATPADILAAYVMWTSTVRPAGFLGVEAVLMSKLWMNKVWSWDNCINGLALVNCDIEIALNQIMLPFQHITSEGRLPDSMTRNELLFDFTKPPIYGWTFFKLLGLLDPRSTEAEPMFELLPKDRLLDIYNKVSSFTRFWYIHRSTSTSAIPYYSHGNDSGWDNSTGYDRQTVCISPDLPAFLVVQCDFLAKLGEYLGIQSEWGTQKDATLEAMVDELWDETNRCFMFKDAHDASTWNTTTLLQFIPLIAAAHLPKPLIEAMAAGIAPYLSQWGLATERLDSNLYEPDGYWRGPIWGPPTLLIESGLRSAGLVGLANTISERYIALCSENGFAENYDALSGMGNRDLSYTWAASAYLTLRYEKERRG